MNEINEKSVSQIKTIISNLKQLQSLEGTALSKIKTNFKTKDLGVPIDATAKAAYTKKLAITGSSRDIPEKFLQEMASKDGQEAIVGAKIYHLLKKAFEGQH